MTAIDTLEGIMGIELPSLAPLQRVLLITDGTLTEILEAYFLEPIRLEKRSQRVVESGPAHARLGAAPGESLLERKIGLVGERSQILYVYAESWIAFERLDVGFREELLHSNIPLGRLWLKYELETFKKPAALKLRPARELRSLFACADDAPVFMRNYLVCCSGRPLMDISEYFPLAWPGA